MNNTAMIEPTMTPMLGPPDTTPSPPLIPVKREREKQGGNSIGKVMIKISVPIPQEISLKCIALKRSQIYIYLRRGTLRLDT
jgi:hypothetical protein